MIASLTTLTYFASLVKLSKLTAEVFSRVSSVLVTNVSFMTVVSLETVTGLLANPTVGNTSARLADITGLPCSSEKPLLILYDLTIAEDTQSFLGH